MPRNYDLKEIKPQGADPYYKVEDHSCIQAIRFNARDLNASDSYANIQRWVSYCHLKLKGQKQWNHFSQNGLYIDVEFNYKAEKVAGMITPNEGLLATLHKLELPSVRQKIERRERLTAIAKKIAELKQERESLRKCN